MSNWDISPENTVSDGVGVKFKQGQKNHMQGDNKFRNRTSSSNNQTEFVMPMQPQKENKVETFAK